MGVFQQALEEGVDIWRGCDSIDLQLNIACWHPTMRRALLMLTLQGVAVRGARFSFPPEADKWQAGDSAGRGDTRRFRRRPTVGSLPSAAVRVIVDAAGSALADDEDAPPLPIPRRAWRNTHGERTSRVKLA